MNINELKNGARRAMKAIKGNERLLFALGCIASGLTAALTGHDLSVVLEILARLLGITDPAILEESRKTGGQIVGLLLAIGAAWPGINTRIKQHKAGATLAEIGSPAGVVKAAVADGTLVVAQAPTEAGRAALEMEGAPVVAKVGEVTVAA